MSLSRLLHKTLLCVLVGASMLLSPSPVAEGAQNTGRRDSAPPVLVPPARRAPDAPPSSPSPLPRVADGVKPLTLEVLVRRQSGWGPAQRVRQTITRASTRIHIAAEGREWLFERNPLDPRRVSGFLTNHHDRLIVFYDESDLRNRIGINGWVDVLTLGTRDEVLSRMRRTPQSRAMGGIQFVRYVASQRDSALTEVWWSESEAFPSAFTLAEPAGAARLLIECVQSTIDPELLRQPHERLPTYKVLDVADWLEGH